MRRFALLGLILFAIATDTIADETVKERQQIERGLRELRGRIEAIRKGFEGRPGDSRDRLADAEVFAKGIAWALEYDATFTPAEVKLLEMALERGRARATALEDGESPWTRRTGRVVRGFVSDVDSSVQPYAVVVPTEYAPNRPMRLDIVLHGSSKPVGMSELRFIDRFDGGDGTAADAPDRGYIELHPLGRVENGYRWAGEADVFEAIEAACRNYNVDRDRIVLRGMSMGASGTWHLGLKHPDRFVALGPYCGYVDTHEFSKTPLPISSRSVPSPRTRRGCSTCWTRWTTRPTPAWYRASPAWARRTSSSRPTRSWAARWRRRASRWST